MFGKQEATDASISAMAMFGIVNDWSAEKVVAELERLGVSRKNIDRVLNQCGI